MILLQVIPTLVIELYINLAIFEIISLSLIIIVLEIKVITLYISNTYI